MKAQDELLAAAQAFGDAAKRQVELIHVWNWGDDRTELDASSRAHASALAVLTSKAKAYATAVRRRRKPA